MLRRVVLLVRKRPVVALVLLAVPLLLVASPFATLSDPYATLGGSLGLSKRSSPMDMSPQDHYWVGPRGRLWGGEVQAAREGLVLRDSMVKRTPSLAELFEGQVEESPLRRSDFVVSKVRRGVRFVAMANLLARGEKAVCGERGTAVLVVRPSGLSPAAVETRRFGERETRFPAHRFKVFAGRIPPDVRPEVYPELRRFDPAKAPGAIASRHSRGAGGLDGGAVDGGGPFDYGATTVWSLARDELGSLIDPSGGVLSPGFALCVDSEARHLFDIMTVFHGTKYNRAVAERRQGVLVRQDSCPNLKLTCMETQMRESWAVADAVVVYAGEGKPPPPELPIDEFPGRRDDSQLWVYHLWEASSTRPPTTSGLYTRHFNVSLAISYRANYPEFWFNSVPRSEDALDPLGTMRKDRNVLALYSTCKSKSGRGEIIRSMIDAFPPGFIESLGKCDRNTDWPDDIENHEAYKSDQLYRSSKAILQRRYKFEIVIQNAQCLDFVDEKIFESLARGVIPIYVGAPNIGDFLPNSGRGVIIRWDHFASDAELAEYVVSLARNETALAEYHSWRNASLPLVPPMWRERAYPTGSLNTWCNVCDEAFLAKLFDREMTVPGDDSCCDAGTSAGCETVKRYLSSQGVKRYIPTSPLRGNNRKQS